MATNTYTYYFNQLYPSDATGQLAQINLMYRPIIPRVIFQNVRRFRPLARWILGKLDVRSFAPNFITQPVSNDLTNVNPVGSLGYDGTLTVPAIKETEVLHAITTPVIKYVGVAFSDIQVRQWTSGAEVVDYLSMQLAKQIVVFIDHICDKLTDSRFTAGNPPTDNENEWYGIKDVVDNGNTAPTFMGLSRSTYTWWSSPVWDVQATFGTGLDAWKYVRLAKMKYEKTYMTASPYVMFTSPGVFEKIAESLVNFERMIVGDTAKINDVREYEVNGLNIQGVYVFPDPSIADGEAYVLRPEYIRFSAVEGYDFVATPFISKLPADKFQYVSYLFFGGQLWSEKPNAFMKLTNLPYVTL